MLSESHDTFSLFLVESTDAQNLSLIILSLVDEACLTGDGKNTIDSR